MSSPARQALLLVNLGTPSAPDTQSVKTYLREFLSDPQVVRLPRWLWWPILHGIVLPHRARRSAQNYAHVWMQEGSPLAVHTQRQAEELQKQLDQKQDGHLEVVWAMRYGEPALDQVLTRLCKAGYQTLFILMLYPQSSFSTNDSVRAKVEHWRRQFPQPPDIDWLPPFYEHPAYIKALAANIQRQRSQRPAPVLIMSFHGIPRSEVARGDVYPAHCERTACLLAQELGLREDEWRLAYQSRFGWAPWLQPYTDDILKQLAVTGDAVDIVCPGFVSDCLETLEEIQIQYKAVWQDSGGGAYRYITALNECAEWTGALAQIVQQHTGGGDAGA